MTQLDLFALESAPCVLEQRVWLRCPGCKYTWHAATVIIGAWWAVPPETCAQSSYCPECVMRPPMDVARVEENDDGLLYC